MMRSISGASLAMLLSSMAFGQATTPPPAFEVASVKVAEQPKPDAQGRLFISRGCNGGLLPRSNDPGTLTCNNEPLKALIIMAYGLKSYQVEGPAWLDTDGYDITAKVPPGTTREQFYVMVQNLLAERFKVVVHRETKNMDVYVLSVGKGGAKLKEVDAATLQKLKDEAANPPAPAPMAARGTSGQAPMPPLPPGATAMTFSMDTGPGGMPPGMAPGRGAPKGLNARMSMNMSNGYMHRTLSGYLTMAQVITSLTNALDRPVTDMTELKGTYDIELSWVPTGNDANFMGGMRTAGAAMAGAMAGMDGGRGPATDAASDPGGYNLPQALKATLGLQLDQKKAPAEMLIIDHAEHIPTEN